MNNLVVNIPINNVQLWAVFVVFVVLFIVVSVVLSFHWRYYGVKGNPRVFAKELHYIVGIIILLIALGLLSIYNVS